MKSKEEILFDHCNEEGTFYHTSKHEGGVIDGDIRPVFKAMSEYACQEAIEFLKWVASNVEGHYFINGDGQFEITGEEGLHSSAELYELFQQSKTTNP